MTQKLKLISIAFGFIIAFLYAIKYNEPKFKDYFEYIDYKYPKPWIETFNIEISRALIKNKVSGCGQLKYREDRERSGEFLVYCTTDGHNYQSYLVWTNTGKVIGPDNKHITVSD